MGPCEHYNPLIWDYLYGLLEPAEEASVRAHLDTCATCQKALYEAEADKELLARAAQAIRDVAPFSLAGAEPGEAVVCGQPSESLNGCYPYRDWIFDNLYGLLEPEQTTRLNAHLEDCPACQQALVSAQTDQGILARAAQPLRSVPLFEAPEESEERAVPAAQSVPGEPTPETPGVLAITPRPRSLLRRSWPVWAAAAAIVVAAVALNDAYQRGIDARQAEVAQAKEGMVAVDARFAALQMKFERAKKEALAQAKAKTPPVVQVLGSAKIHPEAGHSIQVLTRDATGKPTSAQVIAKWLDAETHKVLHEQELLCAGEAALHTPPLPGANVAKVVVQAKAGPATAEITETVTPVAPRHVTHLAVNKNAYYVGEVLFFRTLTLDSFTLKPPAQSVPLQFSLIDSSGRLVKQVEGQTGPGGVSGGELALTQDLISGNYTFQVASSQPNVLPQKLALEIVRDETPQIEFDRRQYKPGDTVNIGFRGGKPGNAKANPYANQAVTVNVFADGQPVPQDFYLQNNERSLTQPPGAPNQQSPAPGLQNAQPQNAQTQNAQNYFANPVQTRLDNLGNSANIKLKLPDKIEKGAEIVIQFHDGKKDSQFKQAVPVVPSAKTIDFFPEGGDLIAGVPNKVYFRVHSPQGDPVDPDGRVIVLASKEVVFDSDPHQGAGYFTFTPDPNEEYSVRLPGGDGITEIKNPFGKLAIQPEGVVLHVPEPISKEAAPLSLVLRNRGPARKLLLQTSCRGQVLEQRYIQLPADAANFQLASATQATGVVRLTLFAIEGERLVPLAERLVFRLPARTLDVSCSVLNGVSPFPPGQRGMHVNFKAKNEKGEAEPFWALAAVIDEKWRDLAETPLPVHFLFAGDFHGEELADANLGVRDTPEARKQLDIFLGTHGWRRFVKQEPAVLALEQANKGTTKRDADGKLGAPRVAAVEAVPFFSKVSELPEVLQEGYQKAVERAVSQLLDQARKERAELISTKELEAHKLDQARQALAEYRQLPRRYLGIALGCVLVALLVLGAALLVFGATRLFRRGGRSEADAPTLSFAGGFCCLFACLVLYLVAGRITTLDQSPRADDETQARATLPDFSEVPPSQDGAPAPPKMVPVLPSQVVAANKSLEAQREFAAKRWQGVKKETLDTAADTLVLAKKAEAEKAASKDAATQLRAALGANTGVGQAVPGQDKTAAVLQEGITLNKEMQKRWEIAKSQVEQGAQKGKAVVGPQPLVGGAPPLGPGKKTKPLAADVGGSPQGKKDNKKGGAAQQLGDGKGWNFQYFREYAHHFLGRTPDLQPTLLWAPALQADNGSVDVNFDLSQSVAHYRILLFANSPDGRLGFYQGQLVVQPRE